MGPEFKFENCGQSKCIYIVELNFAKNQENSLQNRLVVLFVVHNSFHLKDI